MNKHGLNEKEIFKALHTIQNVCCYFQSNNNCKECPFCVTNQNKCGITDLEPDNWSILSADKFRALG